MRSDRSVQLTLPVTMGNKSSSVSLEGERRASGSAAADAASQPPAKATFRETLFKHRKSFRDIRASNKTSAKAGDGPGHDGGSSASPADILGSKSINSSRTAASERQSTSSAVPVPCGTVLQTTAATTAVSSRADGGRSSGGPPPHPADPATLGSSFSEPTYEEIRTGVSPSGDTAVPVVSSLSLDYKSSSGGLAARLSSSPDAATDAAAKGLETLGEGSRESVKVGGGGGSKLRAVFGSLFPSGKKSKKRKSLGGHGDEPPASDPGFTGDAGRPGSRSSGGSSNRQSGRQSGQLDGGCSDVQQSKSCGDRGSSSDAGGVLTATHRRAASYERQLPNLPIGQSSASDETIPKRRCSDDESPKQRRALPDIPHEPHSPVDCGETIGDQIYSAMQPLPPSGTLRSAVPVGSTAGRTAAEDDAYDEIQRDRNPASVKADHRTYAAVDELTVAESPCAVPGDSMYDMLQRDKNPLSVKMQQLKLSNGQDADDDQYSKAVETPPFGSTFGVDSGDIYCEADETRVAVATTSSSTAAAVGLAAGFVVGGGSRSSGAAILCLSQGCLPQSAEECSETRSSGASASAAANGQRSNTQHPPPYSTVKPVAPTAVAGAHRVDRHVPLTPADADTDVDAEPPRVPEKHFDLGDEVRSIDGLMLPPALASSAGVAGEDDDSELYSLPIETPATAPTAAGCSNPGDLPAGYGIITLREPLSMVQERLAAESQIDGAEESDYYESVDKVDAAGVTSVSGLVSDRELGVVIASLADPESDASEVYAVPDELVSTAGGSAGPPPIPPPVPQGTRRRQVASAYEEIKFPTDGNAEISADAVSGRIDSKCISLPAGGSTSTSGDIQPAVAADRNTGTRSSQVRSRRCGYEEVDLPSTSATKPLVNGSHESAATVTAGGGDTCVLFIPPPASDRPLARPLASRGRLAHHYEEVDRPDEGRRLANALKSAGARPPHHYDEIVDVGQQRT